MDRETDDKHIFQPVGEEDGMITKFKEILGEPRRLKGKVSFDKNNWVEIFFDGMKYLACFFCVLVYSTILIMFFFFSILLIHFFFLSFKHSQLFFFYLSYKNKKKQLLDYFQ